MATLLLSLQATALDGNVARDSAAANARAHTSTFPDAFGGAVGHLAMVLFDSLHECPIAGHRGIAFHGCLSTFAIVGAFDTSTFFHQPPVILWEHPKRQA